MTPGAASNPVKVLRLAREEKDGAMFYGIERLGENKIRIGPKDFRLAVLGQPLPDGTYLGVEVAGRPFSDRQEQFDLELLKGAFAYQLFRGLYVAIYSPIVETKSLVHAELLNPYGSPMLKLSLSYTYATWTGETNLNTFCQRLAETFLKELPGCTFAKSKPDDVSADINLCLDIPQGADLYEFISSTDKQIAGVERRFASPSPAHSSKPANALKPDEHGYRWWVRYVLIPLAGSAAVFAIVRYLLLRK